MKTDVWRRMRLVLVFVLFSVLRGLAKVIEVVLRGLVALADRLTSRAQLQRG